MCLKKRGGGDTSAKTMIDRYTFELSANVQGKKKKEKKTGHHRSRTGALTNAPSSITKATHGASPRSAR